MKFAKPRTGEPITLVELKNGRASYRVVLDIGPVGGERKQQRRSFSTLTEARAYVAGHKTERARGTLIPRTKLTFKEFAEGWLITRSLSVRPVTALTYKSCVDHAVATFGRDKELSAVTRGDVEHLVAALVAQGRSHRTAALRLFVLRSIFDQAIDDGIILRNPAKRVRPAGKSPKQRVAFTPEELRKLRDHLADDPLYGCWLLSMYGLRRSEVMGLRWSDVDLAAKSITIERGRVPSLGKAATTTPPKTQRGSRTIHLTPEVISALQQMREEQGRKHGLGHIRDGYLAIDPVGRPLRPEVWTDDFRTHCKSAGIRVGTLHELRHSSVTAMLSVGVPMYLAAAHHGHDPAIAAKVYAHPDTEQLAGAAMALDRVIMATG